MDYETLDWYTRDGILQLTLNRPERMNAFTVKMADELVGAFDRASGDDGVRAIVVTGAGKAFCSGMDLSSEGNVFGLNESLRPSLADLEAVSFSAAIERGVRDTGGRVTLAIYRCTKPVIAAINGAAVGIGATMTLAMDIRLASENARIGFVFGRIGVVPEACSSWYLPRLVGLQRALDWVYSAEILSASQALEGGLLKAVLAPEELLTEAFRLAHLYTDGRSAVAVALTRQMMLRNASQSHPIDAHRIESLSMFYTSIGDGKEGVRAFVEKRAPSYRSTVSENMPPFFVDWRKIDGIEEP